MTKIIPNGEVHPVDRAVADEKKVTISAKDRAEYAADLKDGLLNQIEIDENGNPK